jgi:acyl dehydratase
MHPLTARPLGFPRAIAHGMWSKARCVAALEGHLPDAFAVEVRFRKPILLPGRVRFQSAERPEGEIEFAVRDSRREEVLHLEGRARPANEKRSSK